MSGNGTISPSEAFGWVWTDLGRRSDGPALPPVDVPAKPVLEQAASRLHEAARLLAAAGLLGIAVLLAGFLTFVAHLDRDERAPDGRADGIVALTGGAQRIGDAIDLLAGGYGRRLLITGVNERTSRDEIARMNPSQRHWIACCVDLDYRARNTIGNAIETRRWMRQHHFSTVAVVTSNYHMPRTLVELDHALMGRDRVVPHPVIAGGFDVDRWWCDPAAARIVASEYLKFLISWARTRFEADPERSRAAVLIGGRKPVRMVAEPVMREE